VPGEVSVAGFDDISTAALTSPTLTSVRLPLREMGRRGFAYADRVLAGDEPQHEVLPTEVILRGSTAAPAAATGVPGTGR
jgi:LacI family transcriptional regulator